MTADHAADPVHDPEVAGVVGRPVTIHPAVPRVQRRWPALAAGAAAAIVIGALALAVATGDDESGVTTASTGEPSATPPVQGSDPAPLTCGTDIPATIEVPGAVGGPVPGPSPSATDSVDPGQLVVHWTRPGATVEVRWPASDPPVYDLDAPTSSGGASATRSATEVEIFAQGSDPADPPPSVRPTADVIIDISGRVPPSDACSTLDVRINADSIVRTGINLAHLDQSVDLTALITAKHAVDAPPDAPVECNAPAGMDVPPNRSGSGPYQAQPSPAEALAQFLATPDGASLSTGGYTELVEADGTITYAVPLEAGAGYVMLISVVPSDEGWVVETWQASGC